MIGFSSTQIYLLPLSAMEEVEGVLWWVALLFETMLCCKYEICWLALLLIPQATTQTDVPSWHFVMPWCPAWILFTISCLSDDGITILLPCICIRRLFSIVSSPGKVVVYLGYLFPLANPGNSRLQSVYKLYLSLDVVSGLSVFL